MGSREYASEDLDRLLARDREMKDKSDDMPPLLQVFNPFSANHYYNCFYSFLLAKEITVCLNIKFKLKLDNLVPKGIINCVSGLFFFKPNISCELTNLTSMAM